MLARPAGADTAFSHVRCDPVCNVRVTNVQGPANEIALAVNPVNAQNVIAAAKDYSRGDVDACSRHNVWAGIYSSQDGGRTWAEQLLPKAGPLARFHCISDPVLAFGPDGTAYYFGLGLGGPTVLFVERSTDGGATWQYVSDVTSGNPDKQWAAVDPSSGRVWVAWVDVGAYLLRVAHSDDAGGHWTETLVPTAGVRGMSIAAGPPDVLGRSPVYLSWKDLSSAAIWFAVSWDGGGTWTVRPAVPELSTGDEIQTRPFRNHSFPSMAVDTSDAVTRGAIHIAYTDLAQTLGEIRTVTSLDGGVTWTPPIPVEVAPLSDDIKPQLALGPSGDVHVAWYAYQDGTLDARYAHSAQGIVWDAAVQLSTVASDPRLAYHQDGFVFVGDYIGAAAADDVAYAAWADTRNGRSDVYIAAVQR